MESGLIIAAATAVLSAVSVFLGAKYRKWQSRVDFAEISWSYLLTALYIIRILTRKYELHPMHLHQQIPRMHQKTTF